MSSFTEKLQVEFNGDGTWTLIHEFDYHVGVKESDVVITVPVGYTTDFASVPKLFWNILPPTDCYGKAAVIHDYLYSHKGIFSYKDASGIWNTKVYTRKECDGIFLEAMAVLNVGWWTRRTMYSAVRTFGGFAWRKQVNANKKVIEV